MCRNPQLQLCSKYTPYSCRLWHPLLKKRTLRRDKSPRPALGLASFLRASNLSQTKRRSRSISTLNTRPSSPLLSRLPAYTTTRYDSISLSDSGRALSVLPNYDHCRRHFDHGCTISWPTLNQPVSTMFPLWFQFLSELFPCTYHACTTQWIFTDHVGYPNGTRTCYADDHVWFTDCPRIGQRIDKALDSPFPRNGCLIQCAQKEHRYVHPMRLDYRSDALPLEFTRCFLAQSIRATYAKSPQNFRGRLGGCLHRCFSPGSGHGLDRSTGVPPAVTNLPRTVRSRG